MSGRACRTLWTILAIGLFLLAIVIPSVAVVARAVADGLPPAGGWMWSARQWGLLTDTVILAGAAVAVAVVLSLPASYVVGQTRRLSTRPILVALTALPLLLPPMVYTFGWQRLAAALPPRLLCICMWAAWGWPIPALLVGSGWARAGRAGYEAALLSTTAGSAFVRAGLPLLWRPLSISGLILFVLFLGEYTVPHACGLSVYATDLLGLAEAFGPRAIEVLWPSVPLVGLLMIAGGLAWVTWRGSADDDAGAAGATGGSRRSKAALVGVIVILGLTIVTPIVRLAWHGAILEWVDLAWQTYRAELLQSVAVSIVGGLAAVLMGTGLAMHSVGRRLVVGWAVVFGLLPGALVGQALVAAYLSVPPVYNQWPIVVFCHVARFGWIGLLAAMLAWRQVPPDLVQQARADGADALAVDTHVRLWPNWPTLLCGAGLVAALSLADITAISLVRVPSVGTISLTLIEKMHRFEEGMLVALSLWLVAAALPPAVLMAVALRRRG